MLSYVAYALDQSDSPIFGRLRFRSAKRLYVSIGDTVIVASENHTVQFGNIGSGKSVGIPKYGYIDV